MSPLVTRPSLPEPGTVAASMPLSADNLRTDGASGASIGAAFGAAAATGAAGGGGADGAGGLGGGAAGFGGDGGDLMDGSGSAATGEGLCSLSRCLLRKGADGSRQ